MGNESPVRLSGRMAVVRESSTVSLMDRARKLRAAGKDVIGLAGGEPDFDSPAEAVAEAIRSLQAGFTHYVSSQGLPEFRRAVAEKLKRENGVEYDPDREIVVTVGGKMALLSALLALLDPGDEVLCFSPAWVSYEAMISLAGGRFVPVPLFPEGQRFVFDPEAVRRAVSGRTRAILLNSPHNPTGKVLTREELAFLAGLAQEHDLMVISDEIYEHICFDGRKHVSIASLPGMKQRTVTVNGMSKGYAMTGWRLGYAAADARLAAALVTIQQQTTTCAASFAQTGAAVALASSGGVVAAMVREFQQRRDYLTERFAAFRAIEFLPPEGTFYAFPRIVPEAMVPGLTSAALAERLVEEAGVVVVPGSAFGPAGEGYLRLSFACSMAELEKGMDRLESFFRR